MSISASHGHEKVVQWLVMKKAAINHKTSENCTPLFLASMKGHHEVVKFLLKSKADPLICRASDNSSPVWIGSCNGHLKVVEILAKSLNKQKLK